MKNLRQAGIAVMGILLVSASAQAHTAGEPGDATKPARIVQVTMTEAEGKMLFLPNRIEINKDEQVKFSCATTVSSTMSSSSGLCRKISSTPSP